MCLLFYLLIQFISFIHSSVILSAFNVKQQLRSICCIFGISFPFTGNSTQERFKNNIVSYCKGKIVDQADSGLVTTIIKA